MVVSRVNDDLFRLDLSATELITISNCLNEVTGGVYVEEFHSRVGVERDLVRKLLDQILSVIDASG
jgi:hypothetical protein